MDNNCTCESPSENSEVSLEEIECNRIFLNFTREFAHPSKDSAKIARVKDLFKYLADRPDLQEMKVSGWLDEGKPEEAEPEEGEEDLEDEMESFGNMKGTSRAGGHRFAMSRDFWYRKLNTLKAQKLDEVALEAKDIPPDDEEDSNQARYLRQTKEHKIFSQVPESREEVLQEIDHFEKAVAKPVEKVLKKGFINVYDFNKHFTRD